MPLSAAAKSAIGPTVSALTGTSAPTVARFMNTVVPNLMSSMSKDKPQPAAEGVSKQQDGGGSVLFDGIDGIPTTDKATQQYKRDAARAPPQTVKRKGPSSDKRKQSAKAIRFNF